MSHKPAAAVPARKPYEKPLLRTIPLAADEVLAVGCKLADLSIGPASPITCTTNNCFAVGS